VPNISEIQYSAGFSIIQFPWPHGLRKSRARVVRLMGRGDGPERKNYDNFSSRQYWSDSAQLLSRGRWATKIVTIFYPVAATSHEPWSIIVARDEISFSRDDICPISLSRYGGAAARDGESRSATLAGAAQ